MLRSTRMNSEFKCSLAEIAIDRIKFYFGNKLEIFIGHRYSDNAVNVEFKIDQITFSIKVYEEDDLIVCGIYSFEYLGKVFKDENLFLLNSKRNSLSAGKETIENFLELISENHFAYVKTILSKLQDIKDQVDISKPEVQVFLERSIRYGNSDD